MSHPVDFATKKIERRKNFCVGPVMYDNTCQFSGVWHLRDIAELRGSARLSQIPRSSLSHSPQSSPVSGLVIETLSFVLESNLCETPIEETKSKVARMTGKSAHVSTNSSSP